MPPFKKLAIYDVESTGLDLDYDQVLEAAMVSVDSSFNLIQGSEVVIPVRPRIDVPPHPGACLTHKLSLARLREEGVSEYEFARLFQAYVSGGGTYIGGYNTLNYDDEMIRRLMFRNCHDPYGHEWRDGNGRFDILNLVRTLYAWDPETLNWPTNDKGEVSLKLSDLAPANYITHTNAHNALSDVMATVELLQLVKNLGSKWLDHCLELTDKRKVESMAAKRSPLFHISPFYSRERCYSSVILPLVRDIEANNKILCVDLAEDPSELLRMTPDEIRHYRFTPRSELQQSDPIAPVTSIQINKQPSLAAIKDVSASVHGRMKIDIKECMEHAQMIMADRGFASRLQQAFLVQREPHKDVYASIYSGGFFSKGDITRRDKLHVCGPDNVPAVARMKCDEILGPVEDPRLADLAVRIQGINFPGALAIPKDHDRFVDYLEERLNKPGEMGLTVAEAREQMDLCRLEAAITEEDEAVLEDLEEHLDWIEKQAALIKTRPMDLAFDPHDRRDLGDLEKAVPKPKTAVPTSTKTAKETQAQERQPAKEAPAPERKAPSKRPPFPTSLKRSDLKAPVANTGTKPESGKKLPTDRIDPREEIVVPF